ncbi:MAG TPA: multiheme c-type cytochrome [Puia sp.]|nr:multiheme c-type cytochrome [Puia sp.]
MKGIHRYPRFTLSVFIIVAGISLLTRCINREDKDGSRAADKNSRQTSGEDFGQFAGSASCAGCHKKIAEAHLHTAHYLTSREAFGKYIKGSLDTGANSFSFNDSVKVIMEQHDGAYYQVEYVRGQQKRKGRFDIVVGSGTKGQTFLSWADNRLLQLPITYFTPAGQWSNSPGYPDKPVFNRPITARCLECHSTYFLKTSPPDAEPEEFDRRQIVYGVDCEKCHGPAAQHVAYQQQNPGATTAKYIIDPAHFSRQQSLDLCALCHGGRVTRLRPSFGFTAGDKLSDYFRFDTIGRNLADIDVHGNQLGLLAGSKCFQMSQMTCITCHNTHENEKGKLATFSQRCMVCHGGAHNDGPAGARSSGNAAAADDTRGPGHGNAVAARPCKMTATIGPAIAQNCIGCHMPKQPSRAIAVLLQGVFTPTVAQLRTHLIKIYPDEPKVHPTAEKTVLTDETKAFLDQMKNVPKTPPINKNK